MLTLISGANPVLRAQSSGLLVGIRQVDGDSQAYRTIWIAPQQGKLRVVADGPDLVVPGRTGFFRVCVVTAQSLDDGELSISDSVLVQPATPRRGSCAHPVSKTPVGKARCESRERETITFASGMFLSVAERGDYDCGVHPASNELEGVRSLAGSSVDLDSLFTREQRQAFASLALAAAKARFGDLGTFDSAAVADPGSEARLAVEGPAGIHRGDGRWMLTGSASCSSCGMMPLIYPIPDFILPARVVGHDTVGATAVAAKRRYPNASDVMASPSGDVVAVVRDGRLLVFAPTGAEPGAPVLDVASGDIVMLQWATGRFTDVWSRTLREILGKPR